MDQIRLTHLRQLEAESIHIIREVAAEFSNPVMLYSIGKDSSVMLHLARKAFYLTGKTTRCWTTRVMPSVWRCPRKPSSTSSPLPAAIRSPRWSL